MLTPTLRVTELDVATYDHLLAETLANLYQPSYREMGEHFGICQAAICRRLARLIGHGWIGDPGGGKRAVPFLVRPNLEVVSAAPAGLTRSRLAVYRMILDGLAADLRQPGYREINARLGHTSPNSAAGILRALARKGLIELPKGESRAVRFLSPRPEIRMTWDVPRPALR